MFPPTWSGKYDRIAVSGENTGASASTPVSLDTVLIGNMPTRLFPRWLCWYTEPDLRCQVDNADRCTAQTTSAFVLHQWGSKTAVFEQHKPWNIRASLK